MKAKMKAIVRTLLLSLLFTIIAINSNAQCSYIVSNNLGCDVMVDIVVYDGGGCMNICNSQSGANIFSNNFINVNCSGCSSICNIEVTVTDMNGSPISPVTADFNTPIPPGVSLPVTSAPCTNTGGTNIGYDSSTSTFKIYK